MDIFVAPGASFEATLTGAPTGLTGTMGVRILDNVGGTTVPRTTAGIAEFPASSGFYTVTLTAPTIAGQYTVLWDTGTVSPQTVATDELVVNTSALVATPPSGNDYAASADLKDALSLTGETFADAQIALALTAASRGIDNIANRRFYADADANQQRFYTPDTCEFVRIDDLVTLTAVASDLNADGVYEITWTQTTDFVLAPYNASADGFPFTKLEVNPYSAILVPVGLPKGVRVTGKFGWAAVPEAVKEATIILAAKLLRRVREAPFGVITGLDEVAVRIAGSDPDVRFLIGPFVRMTI